MWTLKKILDWVAAEMRETEAKEKSFCVLCLFLKYKFTDMDAIPSWNSLVFLISTENST